MKRLVLLNILIGLVLITFGQKEPQIVLKMKQDVVGIGSEIDVDAVLTLPSSSTKADGKIELLATKGKEPYSYNWGEGNVGNNILSGLYGDTEYKIYVTDSDNKKVELFIQLPNKSNESTNIPINPLEEEPSFNKTASLPSGYNYYYVSISDYKGNGLGTEENPWSFEELQSNINSLGANDAVLFKRGDTFYGQLDISGNGGSESQPLWIGSYGTGDLPIITGETSAVLNYDGDNLYSASIGGLSPEIVMIDGKQYYMNKYPKDDTYLHINSYNSNTSMNISNPGLIDNEFVGDKVLIREWSWLYELKDVASHNSSNLTITDGLQYTPQGPDGDSYFKFYNSDNPRAFANGTYYYKKGNIYIYSTIDLSGKKVKMTKNSYGINFTAAGSNFHITDLDFRYQKHAAINFLNDCPTNQNIDVYNCNFIYQDNTAINKQGCYPTSNDQNYSIEGCKFRYISGNAINLLYADNSNITGNWFKNLGFYEPYSIFSNAVYSSNSQNLLINRNRIDSVGSHAINYTIKDELENEKIVIEENWISNAVNGHSDGAAIYTFSTSLDQGHNNILDSCIIQNNYIHDCYGVDYVNYQFKNKAHNIYNDEGSFNMKVRNNLLTSGRELYFGHQAPTLGLGTNRVTGNYFLDFEIGAKIISYQNDNVGDVYLSENVFVSFDTKSIPVMLGDVHWNTGNIHPSNNIYIDPFDDGTNLIDRWGYNYNPENWTDITYNYTNWISNIESTADVRTTNTPYDINEYVYYKYNFSENTITENLPSGNYKDTKGNSYSGSVDIAPYRFVVLFKE